MSDFASLHLTAPIADTLGTLGWTPDEPRVREAVPTVARGHNLVLVTAPAPACGGPALAAVLSRLGEGRRGLLLVPEAEVEEWGALATSLGRSSGLRIQVARGASRASRRLRSDALDLLVAGPDAAAELLSRSALKPDQLAVLVLAWPDRWAEDDLVAGLMQDLPKDAQRVVLTDNPAHVTELSERFARKAMTVGAPPADSEEPEPVGPVRTVGAAWARRSQVVSELLELLDPASFTVWTADRSRHADLARALPAGDPGVRVVTGDAPESATVVAFDPPSAERLRQLLEAGDEVVLLVPPGTEAYIERIAAPRRPLAVPSLADRVAQAAAGRRATVARAIEAGRADRALLVLGPLFERFDPAAVAAALYDLWVDAGAPTPALAGAALAPATSKVFVDIGKADGVTPADLVAVLTKEVRVAREKIGRIDLRDSYSLIELPADEAGRIAESLSGKTLRRKRILARLDRAAGSRGGPRGGAPRGGASRSGGGPRSGATRPPRS
ncbi:MAG TPA: DbpA RNA binding domain-containing protein [Gemmatimonadales bacterium]|nr:DbpA RNA binding domain-containing protein [Gemmatimonadales bacterium]